MATRIASIAVMRARPIAEQGTKSPSIDSSFSLSEALIKAARATASDWAHHRSRPSTNVAVGRHATAYLLFGSDRRVTGRPVPARGQRALQSRREIVIS